jgi:hypothetical protein
MRRDDEPLMAISCPLLFKKETYPLLDPESDTKNVLDIGQLSGFFLSPENIFLYFENTLEFISPSNGDNTTTMVHEYI